jgi:hypothetical protein
MQRVALGYADHQGPAGQVRRFVSRDRGGRADPKRYRPDKDADGADAIDALRELLDAV